jgi:ferredoxin
MEGRGNLKQGKETFVMVRKIIEINEGLCSGCGDCVPNCAEGALRIIDGKARMVSDLFCDGLGACLGHCPTGALQVIEREAEPYDEWRVMEKIVQGGPNVIKAHLDHLAAHGEEGYLATAKDYLKTYGIEVSADRVNPLQKPQSAKPREKADNPRVGAFGGCPGSVAAKLSGKSKVSSGVNEDFSELTQWPVQLHLVNPSAPYYRGADLLIAADCTAFSAGNFHSSYLKGKALAVACPKLDDGQDRYVEKLTALLEQAKTVTVLMMEVPCCGGLLRLVQAARNRSAKKVPLKAVILSLQGEKLEEKEI